MFADKICRKQTENVTVAPKNVREQNVLKIEQKMWQTELKMFAFWQLEGECAAPASTAINFRYWKKYWYWFFFNSLWYFWISNNNNGKNIIEYPITITQVSKKVLNVNNETILNNYSILKVCHELTNTTLSKINVLKCSKTRNYQGPIMKNKGLFSCQRQI